MKGAARWEGDCLFLELRVTPRSGRNALTGEKEGVLGVRLAAAPVDGAANKALLRFLAECFDVPRRDVVLLRGATGRHKAVRIERPRRLPPELGASSGRSPQAE